MFDLFGSDAPKGISKKSQDTILRNAKNMSIPELEKKIASYTRSKRRGSTAVAKRLTRIRDAKIRKAAKPKRYTKRRRY